MRITQWGELGILACIYVATQSRDENLTISAQEIAEAHQIDVLYAQQILQRLRKGKIIKSVRGPRGGYQLGREAETITLYDILCATEGDTFEVICDTKPLKEQCCAPAADCNLRAIWRDLKTHVNAFLTKITLSDLVQGTYPPFSGERLHSIRSTKLPVVTPDQ